MKSFLMTIVLLIFLYWTGFLFGSNLNLFQFPTVDDDQRSYCLTEERFAQATKGFINSQYPVIRNDLTAEQNQTLIKADLYCRIAQLKKAGIPLSKFMVNEIREGYCYLITPFNFPIELNLPEILKVGYPKFLSDVLEDMQKKRWITQLCAKTTWSDCSSNIIEYQQNDLLKMALCEEKKRSEKLQQKLTECMNKNKQLIEELRILATQHQAFLQKYETLSSYFCQYLVNPTNAPINKE